jgi:Protein of unknown function (DUF3311)
MVRFGWLVLIVALWGLHQDFWYWREARPLVFGFLPVGLAYHGAYCLAVAGLMWLLTRTAWPSHLEGASTADKDSRR